MASTRKRLARSNRESRRRLTHGEEQGNHGTALPEVHGEQALAHAGTDAEDLLDDEHDGQNTRDNEQGNALAALPGPSDTAEVHGENDANHAANREDSADVVKTAEALHERNTSERLEVGEKQEVDGRANSTDEQVEVERPAPGSSAVTERTTNNRTQNRANTPDKTSQAQVARSLGVGGRDGEKRQETKVHAAATNTSDRATDDEGLNAGGTTAESRCAHEDGGATNVELLRRKGTVRLGPGQCAGSRAERKGDTEPWDKINTIESQDDLGLDVGDDSVVKSVEEERGEQGDDNQSPLRFC